MFRFILLGLLSITAFSDIHAQDGYPSRPVKIVVPGDPGGGFDIFARQIGARLSERWGQQVIVENRAGAAGNIAAALVKQSKPDGYTFFVWNDALLINPSLFPDAGYDPRKDFTPIALPLYAPNVLIASTKSGLKNLTEMVAAAKSGASLACGSPDIANPAYWSVEQILKLAGIQMAHVSYRGAGPAAIDVAGGHIPLAIVSVSAAIEHIRSGRAVALAVTSDERTEALPNIPTVQEAGLKDFRGSNPFFAVLGPAEMTREIVSRLESDITAAFQDAKFRKQLIDQGFQPVGGSSSLLAEMINRDLPIWKGLLQKP